jgi:hypothetical protein
MAEFGINFSPSGAPESLASRPASPAPARPAPVGGEDSPPPPTGPRARSLPPLPPFFPRFCVDIEKIAALYQSFKIAIQASIKGGKAALEAAITSALAGLDFGLTGKVVAWGVSYVLNQVANVEAKALSIALRCEYLLRANKLSTKAAWAAWSLTNKCSLCKCIGHNKRVSIPFAKKTLHQS